MDTITRMAHWHQVYGAREEQALTWFEEEAALSLEVITRYAPPEAAVLDAGGGASRLVDGLLGCGFGDVTVLDLSAAALETSQERLGRDMGKVNWWMADLTDWVPPRSYDLWHDRAVFHFMITPEDRAAYMRALLAGLGVGGVAVIATFALDGPESCSGLPVCRYSPETLAETLEALAPGCFSQEEFLTHTHKTPQARSQSFQLSVFRRTA